MKAIISRLTPEEPAITHECQEVLPDGTLCWQEWTDQAIFNEAGELVEYQAVGRDITEREKAEEALHKSKERFRVAQEISPDGFTILHPLRNEKSEIVDFTWVYENQAIASINGTDPQKVIGKRFLDFFPAHSGTPIFEAYIQVASTGKPQIFEEVYVGEVISKPTWLRLVIVSMGEDISILTLGITERKEAEEEIRALNAELEQRVRERTIELEVVNKELESFAYSVSHDLRAPLRAMSGFSDLLQEEFSLKLGEEGQHYIQRIQAASCRMGELIDDLLTLSRVTRTDFTYTQVDISKLASEITTKLKETEPELRVDVKIEEGLTARGDQKLLAIALENLLNNAWKFSSHQPLMVIEVGYSGGEKKQKTFYIRDNGNGFNMDYADKLFIPFQRLHRTDEFPGTGIGLSIVSRIVERHGGRIWAESEVGKGATFFHPKKLIRLLRQVFARGRARLLVVQ